MAQKKNRVQKGLIKVVKGSKTSWLSKQDKNGWSLGLAMGKKTLWLKGLRFKDDREVSRVVMSKIIYVLSAKANLR